MTKPPLNSLCPFYPTPSLHYVNPASIATLICWAVQEIQTFLVIDFVEDLPAKFQVITYKAYRCNCKQKFDLKYYY